MPVKVQITVWPRNYPTVLETVDALWEMGVRGFAFHCGSVEGVPDFLARGLDHLDPLAWRTLCERLYEFRDTHRDELMHFNFPLLYFTEQELRGRVIGDEELADAYLTHVAALEEGVPSTKPFHACPAMDVPQVYVYANDGPAGRGTVSLCNVHSPDAEAAFADYDPDSGRWAVVQDPARNQMQRMIDSPHLCPAMPFATGGRSLRPGRHRGRRPLPRLPLPGLQPGRDRPRPVRPGGVRAGRSSSTGRSRCCGWRSGGDAGGEPHLARVRRIGTGVVGLRERTVAVLREAAALGGPDAVELAAAGFAAGGGGRGGAPAGPRAATVPLGLPVFVLGADRRRRGSGGRRAAAPCGSCR